MYLKCRFRPSNTTEQTNKKAQRNKISLPKKTLKKQSLDSLEKDFKTTILNVLKKLFLSYKKENAHKELKEIKKTTYELNENMNK